jgi:hypothetical protein
MPPLVANDRPMPADEDVDGALSELESSWL